MVAGYVDQIVIPPWTAADWALFPNAVKVEIVKKASSNWGHVLDVEPGDATPAQAPGWVKMRRAAGLATPCIYVQKSSWAAVQNEFNIQHVPQPLYWIAHYNDVKELPTLNGITAIAKQYHGNDPNNYDLSYVADFWPGVDGADVALDDADKQFIADNTKNNIGWWYTPRFRGNINYAQAVQGMQDDLTALRSAVVNLTTLVTNDAANDVTAQQVADALQGLIVSEVVPAVHDALSNAEVSVDNDAIANAVANTVRDRLLN